MDKSMIKGVAIGAVAMVAVSASGITGYRALTQPRYADVLAVAEVRQNVRTPQETCGDVAVQRRAPVSDQHRIAGTVIGGVLGGVIGNQFGHGTGNTLMTVAGAGAGAYAGNSVQKNLQEGDTVSTTQHRCRTTYRNEARVIGYDVRYRLNGEEGQVRMAHDPGERIPLKDGKLDLTGPQRS